jgi:hypothetical protein
MKNIAYLLLIIGFVSCRNNPKVEQTQIDPAIYYALEFFHKVHWLYSKRKHKLLPYPLTTSFPFFNGSGHSQKRRAKAIEILARNGKNVPIGLKKTR